MWLHHSDHPFLRRLARSGQHRPDFDRVVGVIVNDLGSAHLTNLGEAALYAAEILESVFQHIVAEAERLVAGGYKEIVLTGIHLGHYGVENNRGRDKSQWVRLAHLVERLAQLPGAPDKAPFSSVIEDFYLTNPIARASAVMAECSALAEQRAMTAAE